MIAVTSMVPRSEPADLISVEIPHPRPFVCDLLVGADAGGQIIAHVTNVEYVAWLDRVAELHADAIGETRETMLAAGIMWFVARHEIDYRAEAWPGDRLLMITWVREVDRIKSWRDYVVLREDDGTVVCRATTLWVLMNLKTRRPVRITPEMACRLDPLVAATNRKDKASCTSP